MNKILKMGFCLLLFQIIIILIKPYTHPLQVFLTDFVANIFEFDHSKIEIFVNEYILEIEPLCTGILMYFTLISLFFAFFSFKRALIYSILFIPVVFILNLIRIVSSIYAGITTKNFEMLRFTHDFVWFFLMPIIIYFMFKITEKLDSKIFNSK